MSYSVPLIKVRCFFSQYSLTLIMYLTSDVFSYLLSGFAIFTRLIRTTITFLTPPINLIAGCAVRVFYFHKISLAPRFSYIIRRQ
jgi:hypothetical protein